MSSLRRRSRITRIIPLSSLPKTSNNIIQKGLAFVREQSATVTVPGALRALWILPRRLHGRGGAVAVAAMTPHQRRIEAIGVKDVAVGAATETSVISRQITEAFPWDSSPRYLIRDRDTAYGVVFRQRLRAMGIRDKPTAPRSPWQNPYVERLIGTIRRECLDHMIVFGEAHLRRILGRYAANESRIHRSLDKDAPFHRAIERFGVITSQPVLGGLHHQYCRI